MSRFVRASKYRHVFAQSAKKEHGIENVKITNSAWDTNLVAASGSFLSINWNSAGGGAFGIVPLPSPFASIPGNFPYKLPDSIPLARAHTGPVLDTDWSPHNDSIVASGADDGKLLIWSVNSSQFEGWGQEGWVPQDFDPVLRIDASARKVGQVQWNPNVSNVIATATGESVVKIWDLATPEDPKITLEGHGDAIQSLAWDPTGTLLTTTCRDRKLRVFDPRASVNAVHTVDGHAGIKGSRVTFMGDLGKIATTGFSKMSDRQIGVWDVAAGLKSEKLTNIDTSAGVQMIFWSDNGIIFLAGKGDGNIRYYEYEGGSLHALDEHKSSDPQRGMCFLPRRSLNVSGCEIARAYKVYGNYIEPIAFVVPRKSDSFQSDIFPPAPSYEAAATAQEYFSGKKIQAKKLDLSTNQSFTATSTAPITATSSPLVPAAAAAAANPEPAPTASAPAPTPAAVPAPSRSYSQSSAFNTPGPLSPAPTTPTITSSAGTPSNDKEVKALKDENTKLTQELREARHKIRDLELALEASKANVRKVRAMVSEFQE